MVVCENRTSVLTLPALPGTVAVHGMGFAAPSLAEVPWLAEAATLLYWGDLDTYGLTILGTSIVAAVAVIVFALLRFPGIGEETMRGFEARADKAMGNSTPSGLR